jgi:hypothetical protein
MNERPIICPLCGSFMTLISKKFDPIIVTHAGGKEFIPDKIYYVYRCACIGNVELSYEDKDCSEVSK